MNHWLVIANASRARVFEEIESEEQGVKHCTDAHVANLVQARLLDDGVAAHRCSGLVLVASSPFLGHLKGHLGEQARKATVRTLDADYTALSERELLERLAQPQGSA